MRWSLVAIFIFDCFALSLRLVLCIQEERWGSILLGCIMSGKPLRHLTSQIIPCSGTYFVSYSSYQYHQCHFLIHFYLLLHLSPLIFSMSWYLVSFPIAFIISLYWKRFLPIIGMTETKPPRKWHRAQRTPFSPTAQSPSILLSSNFQQSDGPTSREGISTTKSIDFMHNDWIHQHFFRVWRWWHRF